MSLGISREERVAPEWGYIDAFYELARMMGLGARPYPPKQAWERDMKPRLQALLSEPSPDVWEATVERFREALEQIRDLNGQNYDSDRAWALAMQLYAKVAVDNWLPAPPKVTVEPQDTGASATPSGSRASTEPVPVSALPGFDPSRCRLNRYDAISHQIIDDQGFVMGLVLQLSNGRWFVEIDGTRVARWSCKTAKAAFLTWRNEAIATEARRAETVQQGSVHEGAGRRHRPPPGQVTVEEDRA